MIEVVLTRKEAIPRLRGKKDFEYGPTSEKKAMKTEAEMDGLYQPRHESYRDNKRCEVHDRTEWRRNVSAAATSQPSGSG